MDEKNLDGELAGIAMLYITALQEYRDAKSDLVVAEIALERMPSGKSIDLEIDGKKYAVKRGVLGISIKSESGETDWVGVY